ncbi:PIN domain-containing protein [archaeon]|nr:PIN domain-containing protein [archaeon]
MAQRVIIDTNVFLNVINREEPLFGPSKELLDLVDAGEVKAVVSVITIAELSTGFYLMGDERGRKEFLLHVMSSEDYKVAPVDVGVADSAGRIRAETGLRLPDSIIVSSGLKERVDLIVTHDEGFKVAGEYIASATPEEMILGLQ